MASDIYDPEFQTAQTYFHLVNLIVGLVFCWIRIKLYISLRFVVLQTLCEYVLVEVLTISVQSTSQTTRLTSSGA